MFSRLMNLLRHEGTRRAPVVTLWRMAAWSFCVLTHTAPVFRLTSGGPRLCLPADLSHTSVAAFVLRDHIEPELAYLQMLLGRGGTFIDVGANVGLFALKAAHLVGDGGVVVAVEPGALAFARLAANFALNSYRQVHMVCAAVSDHEGAAVLHHVDLGHDPQAFSLLDDGSNMPGETVRLTTLDRLVAELNVTRVDVVKLDIEGAEAEALAGAEMLLRDQRPIVIFEINHHIAVSLGTHLRAFTLLRALGYAMWEMHRGRLSAVDQQPARPGNLVAIHPEGVQPVVAPVMARHLL